MTDQEAATFGMPTGEGKGLLARSWLDGGLQALASGGKWPRFARRTNRHGTKLTTCASIRLLQQSYTREHPSFHSRQFVLDVLAERQALGRGDEAERECDRGGLRARVGESTSSEISQERSHLRDISLQHRDPDELVQDFSPIDAEDRRRVFWALFSLDTCVCSALLRQHRAHHTYFHSLLRTFLGKTYSPLSDLSSITTRIPSSLPDESRTRSGAFDFNFDQTTSTSSLKTVAALHTIVAVHAKLNKLLAGPTRMSPARVSAMLEELEAISAGVTPTDNEAAVISESLAAVLMSFAYVRLHRSCLAGESGDASWHRDSLVQQSST